MELGMTTMELTRIVAAAERATGLTVRQEFNLEKVPAILEAMGKPFLSPILDPAKNDFTPRTSFWLIAERDGVPVMAGGVRVDDLTALDVKTYWRRMLGRLFGEVPEANDLAFPSEVLSGRVAYFGDLFSVGGAGVSRAKRVQLRAFTAIGHFLTSVDLKPDVTYSFIQDRDAVRGTPGVYGFLDLHPFLYRWQKDPYPAGCPEWIASLPRDKLPHLMASIARAIEE